MHFRHTPIFLFLVLSLLDLLGCAEAPAARTQPSQTDPTRTPNRLYDLHPVSGDPQSLSSIVFLRDGKGWAVCHENKLCYTDNGGQIWTVINSNFPATDFLFTDMFNGWARKYSGGQKNAVFQTSDGGRSWKAVVEADAEILSITFSPDGTGLISTRDGTAFRTEDHGEHWSDARMAFNDPKGDENGRYREGEFSTGTWYFSFIDSKSVIAYGNGIWFSNDNGFNWKTVADPGDCVLYHESVISPNLVLVVGTGPRYWVKDGSRWMNHSYPSEAIQQGHGVSEMNVTYDSISFISKSEGWLSRSDNLLFHTVNAGKSWEIASSNVAFRDLKFVSPNVGWGVTLDANLLRTTDGGHTWSNVAENLENARIGINSK